MGEEPQQNEESKTVCAKEEVPNNGKINPPERNVRKRKFTWTEKRKEAFQKCIEANRKRILNKKENGETKPPILEQPQQKPQKQEEDAESISSSSASTSSSSSSSSSNSSSDSDSESSASTPPRKKSKKVVKKKKEIKKRTPKQDVKVLKKLKAIQKTLNKTQKQGQRVAKQSAAINYDEYDSESNYSAYQPSYCFI